MDQYLFFYFPKFPCNTVSMLELLLKIENVGLDLYSYSYISLYLSITAQDLDFRLWHHRVILHTLHKNVLCSFKQQVKKMSVCCGLSKSICIRRASAENQASSQQHSLLIHIAPLPFPSLTKAAGAPAPGPLGHQAGHRNERCWNNTNHDKSVYSAERMSSLVSREWWEGEKKRVWQEVQRECICAGKDGVKSLAGMSAGISSNNALSYQGIEPWIITWRCFIARLARVLFYSEEEDRSYQTAV